MFSMIRTSLLSWPIFGEQVTVLVGRDIISTLHVRIGEAALAARSIVGLLAYIHASLSVEVTIGPVFQSHISVLTVAVEGCFDSSAHVILLDCVVIRDRGCGAVDVLDIGVRAGHTHVELLTELPVVDGDVGQDGAGPQITLYKEREDSISACFTLPSYMDTY